MRVLIADQDSTLLEALARELGDTFSVDIATTKTTCIDLMRAQNEFGVIVASERLTDGSGLELLSQMEKRWPDVLRVFAIEPSRLPLIGNRLRPFKLFHTIPYPIDADRLRNVLVLAQAALETGQTDFEEIVLGDDDEIDVEPVAAAGAATPPRPRGAVVTPLPRTPVRPVPAPPPPRQPPPSPTPIRTQTPAPPLPPIRGERRMGDRRASPPPVQFPAMDSLAEASKMAVAAKAARFAEPSGPRLTRVLVPVGVALVVAAGVVIYLMSGSRDGTPAPVSQTPTIAGEPTTAPGVSAIVNDIESALTVDDLARARAGVNKLRQLMPDHPRLAFLDTLVRRGEAAQRLAQRNAAAGSASKPGVARASQSEVDTVTPAGSANPDLEAELLATIAASSPEEDFTSEVSPDEQVQHAELFPGRTLEESVLPEPEEAAPEEAVPTGAATAVAEPTPAQPPPPVVVPARLLKRVAPEYPRMAERDRTEGYVELALSITAEGDVENARVIAASPPGTFERAAIDAVRKWKYSPRTENGTPVPSEAKTRIEFKLSN
jgi:TonB family protein